MDVFFAFFIFGWTFFSVAVFFRGRYFRGPFFPITVYLVLCQPGFTVVFRVFFLAALILIFLVVANRQTGKSDTDDVSSVECRALNLYSINQTALDDGR